MTKDNLDILTCVPDSVVIFLKYHDLNKVIITKVNRIPPVILNLYMKSQSNFIAPTGICCSKSNAGTKIIANSICVDNIQEGDLRFLKQNYLDSDFPF